MKNVYLDIILLTERLHRRFLDVIKAELDRQHIDDINSVQTLILYNIGEEQLTIGELTIRGYYLGSNVSYNIKKLVEYNYLVQEKSPHDKRSTRVRLSEKGLTLCKTIDEYYRKHLAALGAAHVSENELSSTNETLRKLERFWTDLMNRNFLD